jgi:hypothetical protein
VTTVGADLLSNGVQLVWQEWMQVGTEKHNGGQDHIRLGVLRRDAVD